MRHYILMIIGLAIALSACGVTTGHDLAEEFSASWCAAAVECGYIAPGAETGCVERMRRSVCAAHPLSCAAPATDAQWEIMSQCVGEMAELECSYIATGYAPSICFEVLE